MAYEIPEKGQIKPYDMVSFGIPISTRHGKAYEMMELIKFTGLVAQKGLGGYIKNAFYDSNSCCCYFTFLPLFDQYGEAADAIKECAIQSISQFDWFDCICHGETGLVQ